MTTTHSASVRRLLMAVRSEQLTIGTGRRPEHRNGVRVWYIGKHQVQTAAVDFVLTEGLVGGIVTAPVLTPKGRAVLAAGGV